MKYITKSKSKTEEKIINSTTLTRKAVEEYNNLLEFVDELRDNYFDLYFKVKENAPGGDIPVSNYDLREFKSIDQYEPKEMIEELIDIRDPELVLGSMNQKGKAEMEALARERAYNDEEYDEEYEE